MQSSSIDWTETTWNPVTGCTKVSAGCAHCYAEKLALRLQAMGNPRYQRGFEVTLHPDKLMEPTRERAGKMVFVNSMSDLLHEEVPDSYVQQVIEVMRSTPRHTYQILTKRSGRLPAFEWPSNAWVGVSVERTNFLLPRLAPLGRTKAGRHIVSFEPLLGPIGSPYELACALAGAGVSWVISGGESGFSARRAEIDWFRQIRDACELASISYYHKQHGGRGVSHTAKLGGDLAVIDGKLHRATPPR